MSKIILDFGSGNTCKNNIDYVFKMINELKKVDTKKHEVIIKWQLFEKAGENVPLFHGVFSQAYRYARELGYKTTSSVFDLKSLAFLLQYDIPFIKIANNRKLDYLIGHIPRRMPIYISLGYDDSNLCFMNDNFSIFGHDKALYCVSDYPAKFEQYNNYFSFNQLKRGISDHTNDFSLFRKFEPEIIEWHYGLEDSTGLDAGPFMKTPEKLKEVL